MPSRPILSAVSVAILWFGVGVDPLDRVAVAEPPAGVVKNKSAKAAIDAFKRASLARDKTYQSARRAEIATLDKLYENDFNQAKEVLLAKLTEAATAEKGKAGLDSLAEAKTITDWIKEYEREIATPPAPRIPKEVQAELSLLRRSLDRASKGRRVKVEIPRGAAKFGGNHYWVFETPMTRHVAQRHCESVGGHLLRIDTQEEYGFVVQLLQGRKGVALGYYIDGSDELLEGQWVFSNGNRVPILQWNGNEPNNRDKCQHSLAILGPKLLMNDAWDGFRAFSVCEWDKDKVETADEETMKVAVGIWICTSPDGLKETIAFLDGGTMWYEKTVLAPGAKVKDALMRRLSGKYFVDKETGDFLVELDTSKARTIRRWSFLDGTNAFVEYYDPKSGYSRGELATNIGKAEKQR